MNAETTKSGGLGHGWRLALSALERYGVVIAFVALFGYNAITQSDTFLKPENLRNLLNQNAAIGVIAVGMTLVIIAGGIDLSVGAVMAFGAAVGMLTMNALFEGGGNEVIAVIVGLATGIALGAACGLLNGLLVTIGRIPAFIVTLAGLIGFRSVTLAIAEGGEIRAANGLTALQTLGRGGLEIPGVVDFYGQPVVFYWNILIFFAVVIAGQLLLSRTRMGRHFIAVGSNETAARYSGISSRHRTKNRELVGNRRF